MSTIQKTLDALQPYVIGIRYIDGQPVVDVVFKEGWTLPEANSITKSKGNDDMNYYMIFSDKAGIGLDDLLDYVQVTIKANIEREKKHEFLKVKVNELKEIFKRNSLTKLTTLQFIFKEDDLVPEFNDFDLEDKESEILIEPTIQEEIIEPKLIVDTANMSEEELEIEEEEKRAENFRLQQKNSSQRKSISSTIELPPKRKISEIIATDMTTPCDCGPNDACEKCIDSKDY